MGWLANPKTRRGLFSLAALAAVVVGFFWNEARKEIYFLCGNFKPGIAEADVRAQLETGHFLQHRTTETRLGSRIVVKSRYNLWMSACLIEIDEDGFVDSATFE